MLDANQVLKAVYSVDDNALRIAGVGEQGIQGETGEQGIQGVPGEPYPRAIATVTSAAGDAEIDLAAVENRNFYLELVENVALTIVGAEDGEKVTIIVQQDAGGTNSFTIDETVAWEGGEEPTVTQTGLAVDVYTLLWSDDLSMWLGAAIQDFQVPA